MLWSKTNLEPYNNHEDKIFMIHAFSMEVDNLACIQQHLGGEYKPKVMAHM